MESWCKARTTRLKRFNTFVPKLLSALGRGRVMRPLNCEVVETVRHTPHISTLFLEPTPEGIPHPGQFVMAWVRGIDEVPMAVSHFEQGRLGITVQQVGTATRALCDMHRGDGLGIRGYYGNGFTLARRNALLIAGGLGIAPLAYLYTRLVENGCNPTVCVGARRREELILLEELDGCEPVVATDDGSCGISGTVVDAVRNVELEQFERIYCCGPERMMAKVHSLCKRAGVLSRVEFSLHRYFKCGIGVCGACCIDPLGLSVCKDGPVFSGEVLDGSEFGHYKRDGAGRKVIV